MPTPPAPLTRSQLHRADRPAWGRPLAWWVSAICLLLSIPGCSPRAEPLPTATAELRGSCRLNVPSTASDEEAIRAVLTAEGELVVAQDITTLMALWADGGFVIDAKNTLDEADNQRWIDQDAIRHRYVRIVFPGAPTVAQPANLQITLDGDAAVVRATTQIGGEVAPAGDRWELVKENGCWTIKSLTFNLEPQP